MSDLELDLSGQIRSNGTGYMDSQSMIAYFTVTYWPMNFIVQRGNFTSKYSNFLTSLLDMYI